MNHAQQPFETGRAGTPILPPLAACLILLFTLGGCVQAKYVAINSQSYAAKAADCELEIFSTLLPDREYEEIGIIEGKGNLWKSNLPDILPKIREEACLVGGDALILGDSDSYSEGDDGFEVQKTTATVIRWI